MKNPTPVIAATEIATAGDINIAINTATWLAKVKDAGSINIFKGENIGMIIPTAHNIAATVIDLILFI